MERVFKLGILVTAMLVIGAGAGFAQDPIVYPAKGQNQQQMDKDKGECYGWAKQQTGFDPMQTPKASAPPPPPQQKGGAVRGAAGGALVGAAVGSLSGEAGKGAAIGAAGGGLVEACDRRIRIRRLRRRNSRPRSSRPPNTTRSAAPTTGLTGLVLKGAGTQ